jgi:hypothetical protein
VLTINWKSSNYDPALQASNTPINVSWKIMLFWSANQTIYRGKMSISDNFAYILKMTERPFTQKSSFGQESVNNTIFWPQH